MAEFNPKVDNVGSNNYINYSERYGGNQAWGTLFEGLAKGADQAVQMNLQKQINGTVEEANNTYFNTNNITNSQAGAPGNGYEVGASDGTVTRGNGGGPGQSTPGGTDFRQLPKPLQDGQGVINNLGKAFENGTYSETNYWSQLNAKVKALKAQFPGYAEDIDRMASNALNSPTANQLRQSVYNDWVSKNSGKKTARDNDLKWLSEDSHIGYLGDDLRQKVLTGTATDEEIAEGKIAVGHNVARQEELKRTKLAYEVTALDASDKKDKATRYGSAAINDMFGDTYLRTFGATGSAYKAFKEKIASYKADGKIDETELADLDKARSQLTEQLQTQYLQIINAPDQNGNVLSQVLGPDEMKKLKDSFDSQLGVITDNFGGTEGIKKLGVLEYTATMTMAAQNSKLFDYIHTTPGEVASNLKAANDASGGLLVTTIQAKLDKADGAGSNPISDSLTAFIAGKAITDGAAIGASVDAAGSSVNDRDKATAVSAAMQTSIDIMSNPEAPVEQRVNAMMSLYGDGNMDFLRKISDKPGKDGWSSRERTLLDLSSPKVAAAVAELEKTNPGSLQQYYDFLTKSAPLVFKDTADSVQSADTFSKYANISINPNGQLELKLDLSKFSSPEAANAFLQGRRVGQVGSGHGPAGAAPLSPGDMIELSKIKDGVDAVHRLNIVMRSLTPALDAMGVKPEERTQYFLDTMGGIKLGAGKQLPTLDVIYNLLTKPSGPTGSTMKNPRGGTVIEDNLTPTSENLQMEGNGMVDTSFEDHMANADVPYNDAVGGSKEYNKKVPLLMGKLTSDLGLNGVQAAGLIGNLAHESAELKPHIPGDGGAAHGWAQWNGSRKKDMLKWTKANGYDPNSDDGNYAYLIHDLQNNYPKVLEHLKQAKTVEEATKIIQDEYERPGVPVYSSRLKYARKALAAAPQ